MVRRLLGRARDAVGSVAPHHHVSIAWWVAKIVASRGRPDRIASATVEAVFDLNDDIVAEERDKRPQPPPDVRLG